VQIIFSVAENTTEGVIERIPRPHVWERRKKSREGGRGGEVHREERGGGNRRGRRLVGRI